MTKFLIFLLRMIWEWITWGSLPMWNGDLVMHRVRRLEDWQSDGIVRGRGRRNKHWVRVIENNLTLVLDRKEWKEKIYASIFFFLLVPFSWLLMFSKLSPLSIFYLFFFLHLFFFTFFSLTPFTPPFKVFLKFYCYPHSLVSTYTALIFLFLMLPFVLVPSLPYSQFSLFTCLVPYDGIC